MDDLSKWLVFKPQIYQKCNYKNTSTQLLKFNIINVYSHNYTSTTTFILSSLQSLLVFFFVAKFVQVVKQILCDQIKVTKLRCQLPLLTAALHLGCPLNRCCCAPLVWSLTLPSVSRGLHFHSDSIPHHSLPGRSPLPQSGAGLVQQ